MGFNFEDCPGIPTERVDHPTQLMAISMSINAIMRQSDCHASIAMTAFWGFLNKPLHRNDTATGCRDLATHCAHQVGCVRQRGAFKP